jgi:IS5 family transposase
MRRVARNPHLKATKIDHQRAKELAEIDQILKEHPEIAAWVQDCLLGPGVSVDKGRPGMTGDQTLRALVVKMVNGFSYEELAFHLADSRTYRRFCGFGALVQDVPKKSCLNQNIKRVSGRVLEWINRVVLADAKASGIEDGRKSRVDCTVTESNILEPSDSGLLWDTVRVLTRSLVIGRKQFGVPFHDRTRTAKRANFAIRTAKSRKRRKLYRRLIAATKETIAYALRAAATLQDTTGLSVKDGLLADSISEELLHFSALGSKVVEQTESRVFLEKKVPAEEKVLSIFEPHTDIILKGGRGPEYGHKICLAAGASGMITDCIILDGNPADSTLAREMVERHMVIHGRAPHSVAFDGGFAAKQNLADIKALGVTNVVFSKRRGMPVEEMARSKHIYRSLVHFRAGVEAVISYAKRAVGLDRCLWKGHASFKAYVWASVLSANLLTLARARIARRKVAEEATAEAS